VFADACTKMQKEKVCLQNICKAFDLHNDLNLKKIVKKSKSELIKTIDPESKGKLMFMI